MKLVLPLFLLFMPISAFAQVGLMDGAPQGFEQLETAKPTVVSLSYGGKFLGNFPAQMTPSTLQFSNPQSIIDSLEDTKEKEKILSALQQPLKINAGLLCSIKKTEDCGKLEPEIAGIIFNENNLSGELFINQHYLSVTNSDKTRYLPLPEKKFSSVYMFNGTASGIDGQNNYTLANDGIFSFGETKLSTASSISNNGLRFDTAALSRERNGWEAGGGLFRSRPMQLTGDVDMAGVSIATSMNTVLDKNKTQGNDILLYLPRRSFVSIYREGRLYSSRAYEAGNQLINTSDLPDGAYNITLRIQEADGVTREEQRFFAKNQELPAAGHPTYYAQGGVVRSIALNDKTVPQLTSKPIMRLGTVRRLTDNTGLGVGLTGISDRAALETGIYWLKATTQLRLTAMTSTRGDIGFNTNLLYIKDKITAAIDARQVISPNQPDIDYQNIFSDIRQISFSSTYALQPNITIGSRASYSAQKNSPSSLTIGPYAQWRIWQRGESSLELNGDIARSNGQNQGDILMRFTHRFNDRYGVTGTAGSGFGSTAGALGNVRGWYERNEPDDYLQLGAGVSRDRSYNIANADADWRNQTGRIQGSIQDTMGKDGSSIGYAGNFAIGAAQLADSFHLGGTQNDKSAVIISAKGDAKTRMKIFINGIAHSYVDVGKQQVVYLNPYNIYRIRLAPENPGLYNFDSNDRQVILYPGNVSKQEWDIHNFYVVVGHVVTENGMPLGNAMLQESRNQVITNENGQLQAELSMINKLHFILPDQKTCEITIPQNIMPINGVLLYKEPLICRSVN